MHLAISCSSATVHEQRDRLQGWCFRAGVLLEKRFGLQRLSAAPTWPRKGAGYNNGSAQATVADIWRSTDMAYARERERHRSRCQLVKAVGPTLLLLLLLTPLDTGK